MIAKNWTCDRFGDTYVIYFDESRNYELIGISRYIGGRLHDPIQYTATSQLPKLHVAAIEDVIDNLRAKMKANG